MVASIAVSWGIQWVGTVAWRVTPLGTWAASGLGKDMLSGLYPHTLEEHPTAKKYNMHVEDHEPYPDEGFRYGDYLKLPERSQHERDPWYDWDHSELRLNWGEPMHFDFDMYTHNHVDTSPTPVSWNTMCKQFFYFFGFMIFTFWLAEAYPSYWPVASKQYPYNNLYLEKGGDPNVEPVIHYEI